MPAKWQQWMPFRIDAFKGSPAVQAMHPAARIGYLYLLACAWQTEDCTLSCDPIELAEQSGLGDELWAVHGPRILRKFGWTDDRERLRNDVLFDEWREAKRIFDARRQAADQTNSTRSPNGHRDGEVGAPSRSADTRTGTGTETKTEEQKPLSVSPTPADVIAIWNEAAKGKLPQAKNTLKRQAVIRTRLKEPGWLPDFRAACAFIAATDWYAGANDRKWVATIDYPLQAGKATELAEKSAQSPQENSHVGSEKNQRSTASQRVEDNLRAVAETAVRRGWVSADIFERPDAAEMAEPGSGAIDR